MKDILKKRYWAFVCYPESLPEDWLDQLRLSGLRIAISPLHNLDVNPDGEVKKPHYHVIITFNGPATIKQANRISIEICHGTECIPLEAVRGYYNYLTHKDNPEKQQYDEDEIQLLNGFDIWDFSALTSSELAKIRDSVFDFIDDHCIFEYAFLLIQLRSAGLQDEYSYACQHTMLFKPFLDSLRNACKGGTRDE